MSSRSAIETIACLHIIHRRSLINDKDLLRRTYSSGERLFAKLAAMRKALDPEQKWVRERGSLYSIDGETANPFGE